MHHPNKYPETRPTSSLPSQQPWKASPGERAPRNRSTIWALPLWMVIRDQTHLPHPQSQSGERWLKRMTCSAADALGLSGSSGLSPPTPQLEHSRVATGLPRHRKRLSQRQKRTLPCAACILEVAGEIFYRVGVPRRAVQCELEPPALRIRVRRRVLRRIVCRPSLAILSDRSMDSISVVVGGLIPTWRIRLR